MEEEEMDGEVRLKNCDEATGSRCLVFPKSAHRSLLVCNRVLLAIHSFAVFI